MEQSTELVQDSDSRRSIVNAVYIKLNYIQVAQEVEQFTIISKEIRKHLLILDVRRLPIDDLPAKSRG